MRAGGTEKEMRKLRLAQLKEKIYRHCRLVLMTCHSNYHIDIFYYGILAYTGGVKFKTD